LVGKFLFEKHESSRIEMNKTNAGGHRRMDSLNLLRPGWSTLVATNGKSTLLRPTAAGVAPREVLCLQAGGSAAEALQALPQGWCLRRRQPGNNGDALDLGRSRVGLLDLGEPATPRIRRIIQSATSVKWIALIPPELLADETVRALIRESCYDYHTLPLDMIRLEVALGRAFGMARLEETAETPGCTCSGADGTPLIGTSVPMQQLLRSLRQVAESDAPVLIQGESGTGKELAALTVHRNSRRADGPFVAVNCGALPAQLIQSELFGHEQGAFTGAVKRKQGQFELANGGTLLLDEIGDLSLDLQVNLLRFLQDHTLYRLGGTQAIRVDIRVMAATHVDLAKAVQEGRFREDLYYRLNVIQVDMPPLRERGSDLALLAQFYLERFRGRKTKLRGFTQDALELLHQHPWPGNVRELVNRIQRAAALAGGSLVTPEDLGLMQSHPAPTLADARAQAERESVERALFESANNVSKAAKRLGIGRVTLYRLMNKYRVNLPEKVAR
jgi:DNA-binding NtrC family response regulator